MIIDTSALIAILLNEQNAQPLLGAILTANVRLVAAPTLVEASVVMFARKGQGGEMALDAMLQRLSITVIEMDRNAAEFSREAFRRYGKGVGNPGVLNYGDCLVYGVARATGYPLLFLGNDFSATDVVAAPYLADA